MTAKPQSPYRKITSRTARQLTVEGTLGIPTKPILKRLVGDSLYPSQW